MDDTKNLVLSAIVAFSVYFTLIFLFVFYTMTNDVKKIDAINKTTVLQLDIILDKPVEENKKIHIKSSTNKKISKEVVKRSKSVSAKQRSDLKSLFANVKVKSNKVSKEKVLNVKKSSIASRYKSKFEKDKKLENLALDSLQKVKNIKQIQQVTPTESKYESDPYYSKIYNIISSRWNPVVFYKDLKAKVIIIISNNGSFSYEFIQYSDNMGFDTQLEEFLKGETLKNYPVNPNKRRTKIEIIFQAKGE